MKAALAVLISTGLFAAGAQAQAPAGASSEGQVITNSKPQQRAQAKEDAKPQGKVKKIGGDELTSTENDAIGTSKEAAASQSRVNTRNAKHPGRAPTQLGGTPDMPGAR